METRKKPRTAFSGRTRDQLRARSELRAGYRTADALTASELAALIDVYKEQPLPPWLRAVVVNELQGKRKKKTGPDADRTEFERLQEHLLLATYDAGFVLGKRLRARLRRRSKKRPRNAKGCDIPTEQHIACRRVRDRLPKFSQMTDGAIANLVSKIRGRERAFGGSAE